MANNSRELKIDEKTTRKYLAREEFSPKSPERMENPSKLDPLKTTINSWLEEEKKRWAGAGLVPGRKPGKIPVILA